MVKLNALLKLDHILTEFNNTILTDCTIKENPVWSELAQNAFEALCDLGDAIEFHKES